MALVAFGWVGCPFYYEALVATVQESYEQSISDYEKAGRTWQFLKWALYGVLILAVLKE